MFTVDMGDFANSERFKDLHCKNLYFTDLKKS